MGIGAKELGIATSYKILINAEIDQLDIKNDTKYVLKMIYKHFENEIFGNCDVQKLLKISKNTETYYIKILKQNTLIEVVKGLGKGKYKFK